MTALQSHADATPALPGIPGVTHIPVTVDDADQPTEWTFEFPNGYGAVVETDDYLDDEEVPPRFSLEARRGGKSDYVTGLTTLSTILEAATVQERLDLIADRPKWLEPMDAVRDGAVVLGRMFAVARNVLPGVGDVSGSVHGGDSGYVSVSIGGWRPVADLRPDLARLAEALGIQAGWKPSRSTCWTYRYEGVFDGMKVSVSCDEARAPEISPEPTPLPWPAEAVAS